MKKSFLISISILSALVLALANIGQNASSVGVINEQEWWTIDELYKQVDVMKGMVKEECEEGDFMCRMKYFNTLTLDGKMSAANAFSGFDILFSNVFPTEQKLRFLFLGRVRLQYRSSDAQQNYLSKIYVGWLDEENWGTTGGSYENLLASFQDEDNEGGMHVLYKGDISDGSVPNPDEFLDIYIGDEFEEIDGRIYYVLQYTNGNGSWGSYKFENYDGSKFEKTKNYEMKFGKNSAFGFWKTEDNRDDNEDEEDNNKEANGEDLGDGLGEVIIEELEFKNRDEGSIKAYIEKIAAPDTGIIKKL